MTANPNQITFITGNAGDAAPQARDAISAAEAAAIIGTSAGVSQIVAGSNVTISPGGGTGVVTINAAGGGGAVSSVTASGAGITATPTTGAVVVANTGVTSIVAGTGITVSGATGAVTINATGGGGGTPGGLTTEIQYNNAGAFGGVAGFGFGGNFLTADWFTSGTQVQFNITGTPAQNVPYRINARTDVVADFVTYLSPVSFIACSLGDPTPGPTQYTNDPGANGGMTAYYGLRTSTTGALYVGDNGTQRLAATLILGMDGTGAAGANGNTISIAGNWSLPVVDGTAGQVLTTNGAGVSTWADPGGLPAWLQLDNVNNYLINNSAGGGYIWATGGVNHAALLSEPGAVYWYNYAAAAQMFNVADTGAFSFTAPTMGFFSATAAPQPLAIADATNTVDVITQLNALLAAMRTLGLIAT